MGKKDDGSSGQEQRVTITMIEAVVRVDGRPQRLKKIIIIITAS